MIFRIWEHVPKNRTWIHNFSKKKIRTVERKNWATDLEEVVFRDGGGVVLGRSLEEAGSRQRRGATT
jgi:hypothetical protein